MGLCSENGRSFTYAQTNPEDYFIAGKWIRVTECKRDFGVFISYDGTCHWSLQFQRPTMVFGFMKNIFSS